MLDTQMKAYRAAFASDRQAVSTSLHELSAKPDPTLQLAEAALQRLRMSVETYVVCLRDDGVLPEHVLILIKSAVWEAIPRHLHSRETRTIMEDVVRWSIDAYFDSV